MQRLRSPFAIAAILGVVALLGLLAYGLTTSGPDRSIDAAIARGEPAQAPAIDLARLSGTGSGSLEEHRGKIVVLNFWASWCKPCRAESPLLERWHKRLAATDRGTVLGVDVLDVSSDARDFVRKYGLTYPMLRDPEGGVLVDYGVVGYPETFVIDADGRIVAYRRGPVDEAFMRREVLPLVQEAA
jgi:cytochrome c biogenesis protein CcmG/thiol:disulfide interchange protein DsbE